MEQHRRRFLATGAAAAVAAGSAQGQEPKENPIAQQTDALLALAQTRFRAPRDEETTQVLRGQIARRVASAELLSRTRLANGDEPAFVFVAEG